MDTSLVLSSIWRFPSPAGSAALVAPESYTVRDRTESRLLNQRQHVALLRRNAARQRIDIDLFHRRRSAAFNHREPVVQMRCETRPRSGEARIDAAGSPLLRTLADLVGREEPRRPCAGQLRLLVR